MEDFTFLERPRGREIIARNRKIRDLHRLKAAYGGRNWRKCKGVAKVEPADGTVCDAEIHWYEAYGVGEVEHRVKRVIS